MSPRRIGILLGKEFAHGSKSFIFFFAILVPLLVSLILSVLFGTLFSAKPKLGIVDEGSSQMVRLATKLDSVTSRAYPSLSGLKEAVRAGAVDVGVVLPQDFDDLVTRGQMTEITVYIWGESLAKQRVILEATLANLIIELAGREVPLEIATTTLGDAGNIPWSDRLLPLVVLMAVVMGGSMIPAASLVDEKHKHTLTALTITPATLGEVLFTKGLVGVIVSLVMGTLILTLNRAFGGQPSLLFLVLALSATLAASFGILLGTLTKDITSLFGTIKVMGTFLYAPALIYLFPQIPAWIGKLFPTYYVVQPVVEITQQGGTWSDVAFEVLVLAGLLVALLGAVAVAAKRAQQREA